jgi:hypothetical protein
MINLTKLPSVTLLNKNKKAIQLNPKEVIVELDGYKSHTYIVALNMGEIAGLTTDIIKYMENKYPCKYDLPSLGTFSNGYAVLNFIHN